MTPLNLSRLIILTLGATLALAPQGATAAEGRTRVFRLPSEPLDQALLRFAVQADVSVGWSGSGVCTGESRPVAGALRPSEALAKMLPPGCGFERVDARSFRLVARRAPPRATPAPPPAEAEAIGPVLLRELIVTAEKRPEPLIASPFPISALSGAELTRLGDDSLQAAAPQLVGVAVTNLGSGRNKIFVRGLSDGSFTGRTQSTVGLYLDDTPITYNAPDPDLRLVDIDRIEVLRGPQGTLYGSGSIGGVIRMVTAKPDPTRFSARIGVEGGLTAHGGASTALELMLNAPLPIEGAAVRLAAYDETIGGYLDNPSLGLKDVNRGRRQGVRLTLAAPLGDWKLAASLAHQGIDTHDAQYTPGGKPALTRDARLREPHDNDFSVASLTASRPTPWGALKLSAAYVDHDIGTRYDATGALGAVSTAAFDQQQRVRMALGQAELSSEDGARAHWLLGLFASGTYEDETADLTDGAAPKRSIYRRRDELTEAAAYGELGYALTARTTLTVGGRAFVNRIETHGSRFELAPQFPRFEAKLHDGGFTPKIRLSYAATPDRVVYVQAQQGFRTGGFNLPVVGASLKPGETFIPRFSPDRLRSYEAGGELPLLHRRLVLRGAIFYAQWRGVQTDQYLASGLPITLNIGDGSNIGLEAEAAYAPDAHWQVRVNALIEDPELTRTADVFPARADIGLPGVPRRMGGADVRYRWRVGERVEATLSAEASYVGRSFLTFAGGPAARMGGYGYGRIAAELAAPRWRLQAYVDNVTDVRANSFAFGDPFSPERQETPLRPRTFGLRIDHIY